MPAKPIGFNRHALIALRGNRTKDWVATEAQCDPANYGRIEKGDRAPSLEVALRIADALGCDIRALVPGYDTLVAATADDVAA